RGIEKRIYTSTGRCIVHDEFSHDVITDERRRNPDLRVVSHPECRPEVVAASDFVGSTGAMMDYVRQSPARDFMILSECGLVSRLEAENADKNFIGSCKL